MLNMKRPSAASVCARAFQTIVSTAGARGALAVGLLLTALSTRAAGAPDEWFRGLDLEGAVARSDLVIVVRVDEVSERKIIYGGKSEQVSQQFKFAPVRTLKAFSPAMPCG